jgi:hypothetical protein
MAIKTTVSRRIRGGHPDYRSAIDVFWVDLEDPEQDAIMLQVFNGDERINIWMCEDQALTVVEAIITNIRTRRATIVASDEQEAA